MSADDPYETSPPDSQVIRCPYCGERLEVAVDWSVRRQEYVEDCQVCCQPMTLVVTIDEEQTPTIEVRTEAE